MSKLAVLDTNVCLDLFVFHDPRWAALLDALISGSLEAVTRDDCLMEWQLVLDYPRLGLDKAAKLRSAADYDMLVTRLPRATPDLVRARLPVCRDPDDQKFLELACDAHADFLITKDKALLKLARKTAKSGLFVVIGPEAWAREFAATRPAENR